MKRHSFAMVNYHGLPIRSHWQDFLGKHLNGGKILASTSKAGSIAMTKVYLERKAHTKLGMLVPLGG